MLMTPLPTVPVQPRGLSRRHIAVAAGALLLFGIGMGFFLKWVSSTPRSANTTPTGEHKDEPRIAGASKPALEDKLDIAADFGEVRPLPAFTPAEIPAAPTGDEKPPLLPEPK